MSEYTVLLETIKKICTNLLNARKLSDIVVGKVTSISPLRISINSKMVLSKENIIICSACQYLEIGDTVALIRGDGGQRFLLIDKVVSNVTSNYN